MAVPVLPSRSSKGVCSFRASFCLLCSLVASFLGWNFIQFIADPPLSEEEWRIDKDEMMADVYRRRRSQACRNLATYQDILDCFPSQLVRPLPDSCSSITTWQDVQRCLTGRFYAEDDNGDEEPFTIHILGERHSGTKWVTSELQTCFRNAPEAAGLIGKIHRDFLRIKHFFQPLHYHDTTSSANFLRDIIVVVVRDPTDWVAAMHELPYHSPAHVKSLSATGALEPLPWTDFVSRPWTMPRSEADQRMAQENTRVGSDSQDWLIQRNCQEMFRYNDVVPCQPDNTTVPPIWWRGMRPLYELHRDGTGEPYPHILGLRSDKIVNFVLHIPLLYSIGGYLVVRYEDLIKEGTAPFLQRISQIAGLEGKLPQQCRPTQPQRDRLSQRIVPQGLRDWVDANVNWHTERLVGYR